MKKILVLILFIFFSPYGVNIEFLFALPENPQVETGSVLFESPDSAALNIAESDKTGSSLFSPVKVNMKHRSATHNFKLLPIPNPSAEQAQALVFSVSDTKRAARSTLLLSLASSLGHANVL
jgi:hypothetical protein